MAEARKKPATDEATQETREAEQPEQTRDDLLDLLRRERADFLNYRSRMEQERAEDRRAGGAEVVHSMLPLLDELDRALSQVPEALQKDPWVRGVSLIESQLRQLFQTIGLKRFGAAGEGFDPLRHEALWFNPRSGISEEQIETLYRPGYMLGNRLLRPAQVGVAGPAHDSADTTAQNERTKRGNEHA